MSQPADLKSLFTGLHVVQADAPSEMDLVIDELDRWSPTHLYPMAATNVCWAPPVTATAGVTPLLVRTA